jgi:NAD(P)-dependent dehydrogenase (short-subunit alcohol dehydrogenase family)
MDNMDRNMNPLSVVITGASTGIGAACALDLDAKGFRVFAGVRSALAGDALKERATERLTPILLDVTQAGAIRKATEEIGQAVGSDGLAGLVNNAGIVVVGPLELLPIDELRRQFEVNVIGNMAVTQALLPLLRQGHGRIVNMGSLNGIMAPPYFGPYAASKFALEALSDCLRVELRRWGISVSLIEPGSVKTPIWEKSQGNADRLADQVPSQRKALYDDDMSAVRLAAVKLAEHAMPVERVVRAVRHAICARRPHTRYPVGAETRLARAARLLPDRFRDRILKLSLGLH